MSWSMRAATSSSAAYMQKAKQGLKITTREDTLARVVGSS